jgi:signal transduction histidine kinase
MTLRLLPAVFLSWLCASFSSAAESSLEADFQNPPVIARPCAWWNWMESNFSKDGNTKDLKAMQASVIGGATIFTIASAVQESHRPTLNNPWPVQSYCSPKYKTPIRHVKQVRSMSSAEAAKSHPVELSGVVTWRSAERIKNGFLIDQAGTGIFVVMPERAHDNARSSGSKEIPSIERGDVVQITGVTQAGRYSPQLLAHRIHKTGQARLPDGEELGLGHLLTGKYDAQRVALKGVVTSCQVTPDGSGTWTMMLAGASGKARAVVPALPNKNPHDLEDSGVLIRGVVFTLCNHRQEFAGISIETNRVWDVMIYRPSNQLPFEVPELEPGRLKAYVPGGYSQHRRRISGTVTLAQPGLLYLEGPSGGSRVTLRDSYVSHAVGDVVEASGFVEPYQSTSELASAITRKIADSSPRIAVNFSLNHNTDPGPYDGRLVQMRGVVLESHRSPQGIETLVSDRGYPFQTILTTAAPDASPMVPGSVISVTGIAEITYQTETDAPDHHVVSGVRLLLRSPQDITLLEVPPWWTARRLFIALGLLVMVVSLLAGSAIFLMRRVRAQSHQLASEALAHRQITAAHSAMMEERSRLAGDMHDSLQPMLSGLAFYLDAADTSLKASSADSGHEALDKSRSLLSLIRHEFRQCIWCLYELGRQTGDLHNELLRLARIQRQWSHAEVVFHLAGEPFTLPPSITRGLLLACQEAVENATRHGKAKRIEIFCSFSEKEIEIIVKDNGIGFNVENHSPEAGEHYGLLNMKQRLEKIGGTLSVFSQPQAHTSITMKLSRHAIERIATNPLANAP